jgi:hypothetical protein
MTNDAEISKYLEKSSRRSKPQSDINSTSQEVKTTTPTTTNFASDTQQAALSTSVFDRNLNY